jgi:16S rRNA (guanine(1405)-N(7))-methyltransferase
MGTADDPLDRLVAEVLRSPKYSQICEEFVRRVGAGELGKRRSLKEAVKATKNKLHQVGGAYLDSPPNYVAWQERLAASAPDQERWRETCRAIMAYHASTRERLPILDEFFATALADLAPVRSVLDVACGLDPLAIPWMPLAPDAAYYAYDIYRDMIGFIDGFMRLVGVNGQARARDMLQFIPPEPVEVAYLLKTIPCLEQVDKSAGLRLLETVHAGHVLVSFPVRSLGGFDKGMADNYEARLHELLAGKDWPVKRFEFATELAFLVDKRGSPPREGDSHDTARSA